MLQISQMYMTLVSTTNNQAYELATYSSTTDVKPWRFHTQKVQLSMTTCVMLAQVSHFRTNLWLHDSNEIVSNAIQYNCQETVHCKDLYSCNNCQRTFKVIGNGAIQDC